MVCPKLGGAMNALLWAIPLAVFLATGFVEFMLCSYLLYTNIVKERNQLLEKAKPKLKIDDAIWASNRGLRGGTWYLKIQNQGLDDVLSFGILEQIELASPQTQSQSMSNYSQSCELNWGGANPVPGRCSSILDVIYREPSTHSSYHYGLACNNYDRKNIGLPTGMDILLIISVKAKNSKPLFTVCYFLGKDAIQLDRFEILASNLKERPTIDECRQMLIDNNTKMEK
jgi:hypothetical protein